MNDNMDEIRNGLAQILTVQYDYPPNGEGSVGYKGNNLLRPYMGGRDVIK